MAFQSKGNGYVRGPKAAVENETRLWKALWRVTVAGGSSFSRVKACGAVNRRGGEGEPNAAEVENLGDF
jgi:hypothetical protein